MKKWIPALLLPLVLWQSPALAQAEPQPEVNRKPPAKVLPIQPSAKTALVPMERTAQIRLQLVSCGWWLDCGLARLLLPASATIPLRQLYLDNPTTSPINILNTAVILDGDITGYQLTEKAIAVPQGNQSFPANKISSLPLTLNRTEMPPDQYTGAVYLTLNNGDRLSFPIDLSVRTGPLLPLVVLFFGVILGRLFKYMEERGEPQSKSLKEINRLQRDIEQAELEDEEKKLLSKMLKGVRKLAYDEQLEAIPVQTKAIRDRLDMLVKLEALENELEQQQILDKSIKEEATSKIHRVRRLIAQGESEQDAEAKQLLTRIGEDFNTLEARGGVNGDTAVESSREQLKEIVEAFDRRGQPIAVPKVEPTRTSQFQQFLIALSGVTDQVRAEASFWVVRPLLALILLVGLASVGMGSLYVEKGATFGARPFADYLSLILWGLSADVASRSLSSLQGRKEP